jgi:DNA-binding transcriptional LysR family regulator
MSTTEFFMAFSSMMVAPPASGKDAARAVYREAGDRGSAALGTAIAIELFILAMNDHLAALRLFVRVARQGSFSAAGRDLKIPQPTASRTIAALEREIGAALFTRTTRAVTLTEAGAEFLARIEPILAALDEAEHAARGTGELRGLLRVGLSSSVAIREVIPRLPAFVARHPALRLDLVMDDQVQDLVAEGVDVALRFGTLPDSTATARRITAWPRVLVASPDYLARAAAPIAPAELAAHVLIVGPSPPGHHWTFARNGEIVAVRIDGRLTISLNEAATAAAVAGLGIVSMTLGGCRAELTSGKLVRVLPDWDMGLVVLHALFGVGRAAKPAARAFADFLIDTLGER